MTKNTHMHTHKKMLLLLFVCFSVSLYKEKLSRAYTYVILLCVLFVCVCSVCPVYKEQLNLEPSTKSKRNSMPDDSKTLPVLRQSLVKF